MSQEHFGKELKGALKTWLHVGIHIQFLCNSPCFTANKFLNLLAGLIFSVSNRGGSLMDEEEIGAWEQSYGLRAWPNGLTHRSCALWWVEGSECTGETVPPGHGSPLRSVGSAPAPPSCLSRPPHPDSHGAPYLFGGRGKGLSLETTTAV